MPESVDKTYGPLKLGHQYIWEEGDTLTSVALKYCRDPSEYTMLETCNSMLIYSRRFRLKVGDVLKIPPHWLPLQNLVEFDSLNPNKVKVEPESHLLKIREEMQKGIINR